MNSSLKITERKEQLGLRLLNDEEEFFLYGKALIALWKNRGQHVLVKHHNTDTKTAIGYHPGQVAGLINGNDDEVAVSIYKGGIGKTIGKDVHGNLTNVVQRETFTLTTPDIKKVVEAFEVNQRHSLIFEEMALVGTPTVLS